MHLPKGVPHFAILCITLLLILTFLCFKCRFKDVVVYKVGKVDFILSLVSGLSSGCTVGKLVLVQWFIGWARFLDVNIVSV